MSPDQVTEIFSQAMKTSLLLLAPMLIVGFVVGLVTNILQAATQINESTLSVVPKLIAMLVAFLVFAPWMMDTMIQFTLQIYDAIPQMVR